MVLRIFNLISRRKGTKFPGEPAVDFFRIHLQGVFRADDRAAQACILMFARGTIFPIFGQHALFRGPQFGCKLLNSRSLDGVHEGQAACDFQG